MPWRLIAKAFGWRSATDEDGETYLDLLCSVCMRYESETSLVAVSIDEHWCYNEVIEDDDFDAKEVRFNSDIDRDLGETVFYLHNDDLAVSLPSGWEEGWL